MADSEIEALNTIIATLEELDESQRGNVLLYVNTRYGGPQAARRVSPAPSIGMTSDETPDDPAQFSDLGDLFDAANPKTQPERVLVVAYWKQVVEGGESFESQPVNTELKHLGHGVANITNCLGSLTSKTPKLVLQVAKSGKSQQARKRYKVTREGIRRVEAMVSGQQGEENGG